MFVWLRILRAFTLGLAVGLVHGSQVGAAEISAPFPQINSSHHCNPQAPKILMNELESEKHTRVAIATQGKAAEMKCVISWLPYHSQHHHFVLLSFDVPIQDPACVSSQSIVTCIFSPNSTWTTGRNELAQSIFDNERKQKSRFKFWYFSDADVLTTAVCRPRSACIASVGLQSHCYHPDETTASCCLKAQLEFLESPPADNLAEVSFILNPRKVLAENEKGKIAHTACNDALSAAFHRLVVPLALPYDTKFDDFSWWASQMIHFVKARACYPDFVVKVGVVKRTQNTHANYPKGIPKET